MPTLSDGRALPQAPADQAHRSPVSSPLRRWWDSFEASGREKGLHALALGIRLNGGEPSGNLRVDAHRLAKLRGFSGR